MLAGLQNVTFEFGARTIVRNATWHIHPMERIGLVGYNGTGKSTLLKLFVGEYSPNEGTVERSRSTSIGYLHQDLLSFDTSESIREVAMHAFDSAKRIEKEMESTLKEIETNSSEELLHKYSDQLAAFEEAGGYVMEHQTEEVLQGLGFSNDDLKRPYREFSGGWRMRVLLAKMILQQPDLLLMDEPTNHLDLPSIEWLEKYLQHYKGAVVVVSHDKFFLNRMVKKVVELYQKELHFYNGDYEFYEVEKQQRVELQQRAFENQQDYIRQQERFIERFKAKASKAAAAQSVVKRLERLDRIEDVQIERPDIRINFNIDKEPGRVLVELKNISKHFKNIHLLEHASAEIDRGDKIALIGANGKGKSTLLRIVAGVESFEGDRKWGHNVDDAFYAQHQLESLNTNNTIIEEMKGAGSNKTELELRTLLGCFLFSGDDADKKIKVLSGGEKARVALAKTITSKANFLLLDEPTNHLDIHSNELLIDALNRYQGSFILVSHDRYFISKTANKIWEIVDKQIKEFKGTYQEWVEWNERMAVRKAPAAEPAKTEKPKAAPQPTKQQDSREVTQWKKELQQKQKQFQQAEEKLNKAQAEKTALEAQLAQADIYADPAKFKSAEAAYQQACDQFSVASSRYETLFEEVMALEEKIG